MIECTETTEARITREQEQRLYAFLRLRCEVDGNRNTPSGCSRPS